MTAADLLTAVLTGWQWTGIEPAEVIACNAFGNVLVRTSSNGVWRISPEELAVTLIAESAAQLSAMRSDPKFIVDWEMTRLTQIAEETLGPLTEGQCYCLKIPAVLGGGYDAENMAAIRLTKLLVASGDTAQQIVGIPNGGKVRLVIGKNPQ